MINNRVTLASKIVDDASSFIADEWRVLMSHEITRNATIHGLVPLQVDLFSCWEKDENIKL